ncbi:MAG: TetR/AcrR family transcriptional regulator [Paludibacter sp.]|nr:TetR/AcrR family transcriptional regulator [Paludibacter sp.]
MENNIEFSTEQMILKVAQRLFLEKGFALTSTTEIAKAVGCNQALVHYYFRTKDNLFNTIFEQKFKMFFVSIFETKNMEESSFQDKIKHIIEAHFDMVKANSKLPLLIINEFSRRPEQVKILKEKLQPIAEQAFVNLNKELENEIDAGRIQNVTLIDLMVTLISLNLTLFLLMPLAVEMLTISDSQKEIMYQHRKSEHIKIILNYLRPN